MEQEQNDLEQFREFLVDMDADDLEDFLKVSVGNSPLEALSLTSLILFVKTNIMGHMDQALRWAETAAATAAFRQDCVARFGILIPMLAQRGESLLRATQLGLAEILDVLVEAVSDAKGPGIHGQALLHEAYTSGNLSVARILLKGGIDPNEKNEKNETALLSATSQGDDECVRLLLEHKADLEAEDEDGDSSLHTAAYHGFESIALALLENGAKPAVCGGSGYTPMQIALNRGHLGVANLLLKFKAFPDLADDTRVPLNQISGGNLYRQIELAQEIMFPATLTLGWLDRMRFVVAAGEGSDHDIRLIEPGPGCTMAEPYIAVSYCWGRTSSSEEPLLIRVPSRDMSGSTEVREARASRDVLLRSLEYAAAKGVNRIWIDQECIHQDDVEDKKDALQNMHLVYSRAKSTLVLLDRHVRALHEITLLSEGILRVGKCPELKKRITGDRWFTRAWTCQEYGVTPMENLRYLIGWDEHLDQSGDWWKFASANSNRKAGDIRQDVSRTWELSHREIGGISFEGEQGSHIIGLVQEIGMIGASGGDGITYTLTDSRLEEMYWWRHGLSFNFGTRGRKTLPDVALPDDRDQKSLHARHVRPKLRMTLLAALSIQRRKACTVFSDKLAILGNLADYPYRLHPSDALEKEICFSACALAMALSNGDLSPLFTNDLRFLGHNVEADVPRGLLLSHADLYTLSDGRSAHSRHQAQANAGRKCLILGGKLVVEGILWHIVPFTDLSVLEKTIKPRTAADTKDPIRFHFLQALILRIVTLQRIDLLELVVVSVMRRQLTSPLELVHILNELQAWSCNERPWPANIFEESHVEQLPAPPGAVIVASDGRKRRLVRYLRTRETTGLDYALGELESDVSHPDDLLSYIHHAVVNGRPLALGECRVGDQILVSLFTLDPSQHQWILTPVNELEYEFGKNPWLHRHPKDTFWSVTKCEQTVSAEDLQRASTILNLEAKEGSHLSEMFEVITSGTRSHVTGMWSPRLSRRGVLTIAEDGLWNMIPLGQASKYSWLIGV